jgi:hypothetical protein
MPPARQSYETIAPPRDFFAGILSYLVPGMGQLYQGRTAKGFLFLICICGLFSYGVYLGRGRNVFLPDNGRLPKVELPIVGELKGVSKALYYRPQFLGQFWMGVAVWPAIVQYRIYEEKKEEPDSWLGRLQRQPDEKLLNELQTNGDKSWDLGWIFTVIAGVLNIMVIYDAIAGPAFHAAKEPNRNHAEPSIVGSI